MKTKCFFINNSDGYTCRVVLADFGKRITFHVEFKDRLERVYRFYIVRYCRGQYKVFQDSAFVPISMQMCFPAWDLRRIRSAYPYTLVTK